MIKNLIIRRSFQFLIVTFDKQGKVLKAVVEAPCGKLFKISPILGCPVDSKAKIRQRGLTSEI